MEKPKLAAPGAGLPFLQTLLLKYFLVPKWSKQNSWSEDIVFFQKESDKVLNLAQAVQDWDTPVLVPKLRGLEDSSRYWSAKETVEHMCIVGENILNLIELLHAGKKPNMEVSIAAVKPKNTKSSQEEIQRFQTFVQTAPQKLKALEGSKESNLTHEHPWFGPLTPKQWAWLIGVHQGIHRRQLEHIVSKLPLKKR